MILRSVYQRSLRDLVRVYRKSIRRPLFSAGFLVILVFLFLSQPSNGGNISLLDQKDAPSLVAVNQEIIVAKPPPVPEKIINDDPEVTAQGITVFDLSSHTFLFEKNGDERFLPASLTKIATALIALKYCHLQDIVEVKNLESDGSQMGLQEGEKISFENLLYGLFLNSGNDAARVLADGCFGGDSAEINRSLGFLELKNTHLAGPTGLEEENHYTSPRDLALISAQVYQSPEIQHIVSTQDKVVTSYDQKIWHSLTNLNPLLGKLQGVVGLKTGWTPKAGECMVTVFQRMNRIILIVVLQSQDREKDTQALIDWTFRSFQW